MNRPRKRSRKPIKKRVSLSVKKLGKRNRSIRNRRLNVPFPLPSTSMHLKPHTAQPLPLSPVGVSQGKQQNRSEAVQIRSNPPAGARGEYDVLRFPVIDWDFRWQRPQQISEQFALHGHRVFYITTDIAVLPMEEPVYEDVARHVGIKRIEPNIWLITLCATRKLNLYRDLMNETDIRYLSWSIDYVRARFRIEHLVSIVDLPFWTPLVTAIGNHKLVYDCMDEHQGFSTNDKAILSQEEQLVHSADLVVASSQALYDRMKELHPSTLLLRNAADASHFYNPMPVAPELTSIRGPVIGYYGAISDWFDIRLIGQLAARRPDWTFVLIGHTFGCDTSVVESLPNVMLLGEKPYERLPSYLHRFDVALIPFLENELTRATNPVKLYEYLAAGKPVVSTYLPELETVAAGLTLVARTPEDFEQAIERSLQQQGPREVQARMQFARSHTWEMRYIELHEQILSRLFPKVSVVILTYNNWAYTRQCLTSLQKPGRYPNMEVIVIDNGSTDETRQRLAELDSDLFRIMFSSTNLGFAAGNSLGCRKASGEYIILLNNDTIVPDGSWIRRLIHPLAIDPDLGMTGPMSNHVGNDQAVDHFVGNPVEGAHSDWLRDFYEFYEGGSRYTDLLGFFCVAIKRSVIEQIGDLDSNYGVGMFEDDDYCERVKRAGYKLAIIEDAFVYHHGSATIKKLKPGEYDQLWRNNKSYYERKWNKVWQMPKPPENRFSGAVSSEEVASRLANITVECVLVLGEREWSRQDPRWKRIVKQLAADRKRIIVVHLMKYHQQDVIGIRKAGPQVYFTNRLDLFSRVRFDSVIYCGETEQQPDVHARRELIDGPSYHAHQLRDLTAKLENAEVLEELCPAQLARGSIGSKEPQPSS